MHCKPCQNRILNMCVCEKLNLSRMLGLITLGIYVQESLEVDSEVFQRHYYKAVRNTIAPESGFVVFTFSPSRLIHLDSCCSVSQCEFVEYSASNRATPSWHSKYFLKRLFVFEQHSKLLFTLASTRLSTGLFVVPSCVCSSFNPSEHGSCTLSQSKT